MSNVLDVLDQTIFDVGRATGSATVLQCLWVYNRPIDIDGLRQFRGHLERGRLSRRIEQSPLPFGRRRWVASDCSSDIEIVASARPREAFDGGLDEQANTPLDCEHGPEWHLAVLPFNDGGAGVSLVISHCLTLMSKRLLKAARGATRGAAPSNLVGSSNVGVIDVEASRPDGTDADSFAMRIHHIGMPPARR